MALPSKNESKEARWRDSGSLDQGGGHGGAETGPKELLME